MASPLLFAALRRPCRLRNFVFYAAAQDRFFQHVCAGLEHVFQYLFLCCEGHSASVCSQINASRVTPSIVFCINLTFYVSELVLYPESQQQIHGPALRYAHLPVNSISSPINFANRLFSSPINSQSSECGCAGESACSAPGAGRQPVGVALAPGAAERPPPGSPRQLHGGTGSHAGRHARLQHSQRLHGAQPGLPAGRRPHGRFSGSYGRQQDLLASLRLPCQRRQLPL